MLIAILTLAFFLALAVLGLTGVGAYDSRDAGVSLRRPYAPVRCSDDDLLAPQQRRSGRAARPAGLWTRQRSSALS